MSTFYDMEGRVVSMKEWSRLFSDPTYKVVEQTTLPSGVWVSTVLLGIDHRFNEIGPPIIFETMVFPAEDDFEELDMDRYVTKEQAEAGHRVMVAKWTGWTPGDEPPSDDAMVVLHSKEAD